MRLGLVTAYTPRRHEMAELASELRRSLSSRCTVLVCAIDRHGLEYPDEVTAVVAEDRAADYRRGARILAEHGCDVAVIEYDDELYGGVGGAYVLELADDLLVRGIPYLLRLHSLGSSGPDRRVLADLAAAAAAVLVPGAAAADAVLAHHISAPGRVLAVPLGIPPVTGGLGVAHGVPEVLRGLGRSRLVTVLGAIEPGHRLEHAVEAFAKAAVAHPDLRLALGHMPFGRAVDLATADARYLDGLRSYGDRLGVAHLTAVLTDRLSPAEQSLLLGRSEVLVLPSLPPDRLSIPVFGAASAAGCPVISVPHPCAIDALAGGAGSVVPVGDATALAGALAPYLEDPAVLRAARTAARRSFRQWSVARVAEDVLEAAAAATSPATTHHRTHTRSIGGRPQASRPQLDRRDPAPAEGAPDGGTDESRAAGFRPAAGPAAPGTVASGSPAPGSPAPVASVAGGWAAPPRIPGLLPGGVPLVAWWPPGAPPEPPGELAATPDVALLAMAAADLAAISLPGTTESTTAQRWARRALAGLVDGAYHPGWRIRGLAALTGPGLAPGVRGRAELALARRLEDFAAAADGATLGDTAHVVLALCGLPGETAWRAGLTRLAAARHASRGPAWPWFADRLPGGGIRLPHAMLVAANADKDAELMAQALESLDWFLRRAGLGDVEGVLALPSASGERAVDVADVVLALVDALRITGRARYGRLAQRALAWFAGVNRYGFPAYDALTGRCVDRIGPVASAHSAGAWLAYRAAVRAICDAGLTSGEVPDGDAPVTGHAVTSQPVRDDLAAAA